MSKKTIDKEPTVRPISTRSVDPVQTGVCRQNLLNMPCSMAEESATCLSHYATVLEALGETDLAKVYRSQAEARKSEGME